MYTETGTKPFQAALLQRDRMQGMTDVAAGPNFFSPNQYHRNPYERSRRFPEDARFPPSLSQHQDSPRTAPAMLLSFRQPPFAVVRQRLRARRLTRRARDGHHKACIAPHRLRILWTVRHSARTEG